MEPSSFGPVDSGDGQVMESKQLELITFIQSNIRRLMGEVLSVPYQSIGLDDNFFNLGGDSVRAIVLSSKAQTANIKLTVPTILQFPTVRRMTDIMLSSPQGENSISTLQESLLLNQEGILAEIRAQHDGIDHIESIYPCTPMQEGLYALSLKNSRQLTQYIITIPSSIEKSWFCTTWESIVAANDILRTVFAMTSAGMMQVVLQKSVKWASDSSLSKYLDQDRNNPSTFGEPLARFAFISDLTASEPENYFVLSAHHAVFDAWTLSMFIEDIREGLKGSPLKRTDSVERPKFSSFVRWVQGQDPKLAKDYWNSQLEDSSPTIFPLAKSSDASLQLDHIERTIDLNLIRNRHSFASTFPPSILLRAAWGILVSRYTGSTDLVFGATVNGRNAPVPRLSDIAGPTLATIPVRAKFAMDEAISSFLKRMNDQLVSMIPFEHIGVQNIKMLCPNAQEACNFQTLLIIQSASEDKKPSELKVKSLSEHECDDFMPYPLILECTLEDDNSMPIKASFAPSYISSEEMEIILVEYEHILGQLAQSDEMTLLNSFSLSHSIKQDESISTQNQSSVVQQTSTNLTGESGCQLPDLVQLASTHRPEDTPLLTVTAEKPLEAEVKDFWISQLQGSQAASFPPPTSSQTIHQSTVLQHEMKFLGLQRPYQIDAALKASWAVLMSQYTASDAVIFGLAIGTLAQTMPIRISVDRSDTTEQFLQRILAQSALLKPFEHTGLEKIKSICSQMGVSCDFNTLLVVHYDEESLASARSEHTFDYSLTLQCSISESSLTVEAIVDEDVLPSPTVKRILQQLDHIIHQLLEVPASCLLSQLDLLNQTDMEQIKIWNTDIPDLVPDTLHGMIQQHSGSNPAVCAWDGNLTYDELHSLSSSLAYQLVEAGVKRGDIVLLGLYKSQWTIVSLLAILKCGAAFAPLDPAGTTERFQAIINQTAAQVALADPRNAATFADLIPTVIVIDDKSLNQPSKVYEGGPVAADDMAYILFTSGTTGQPKGVVVQHQAICTSLLSQGRLMELTTSSRTLQFSSMTFDVSILEIFGTLIFGGCVCVPADEDRLTNLAAAIRNLRVNWMFLTPSVLQLIRPEEVPELDILVFGGEAGRQEIVEEWCGKVKVYQGYGPTECSVLCLITKVLPTSKASNLGYASGCRTWVVDHSDYSRLAPIGALGELVIEGPSLARGYYQNEVKTKQAFVTKKPWFSKQNDPAEIRLYRTGDLVKYNPDGTITYVMRASDDQVKINGQRVELNEVESHVQAQVSTGEQVIMDLIPASGNSPPQLVAFLHSRQDSTLTVTGGNSVSCRALGDEEAQQLQEKIKKHVASYMVPSKFFHVSGVPISAAGKVNRKQLRSLIDWQKPELQRQKSKGRGGPPSTSKEILLHSLWSKLLSFYTGSIGIDDSFLVLGGDSIKAMQLSAMARQAKLDLSVPDIFRNPILKDMANVANQISESMGTRSLDDPKPFSLLGDLSTEIQHEVKQVYPETANRIVDIYPCTPLQEGLMSLSFRISESYVAQHVMTIPSNVDPERLKIACQNIIRKIPILRTYIAETELHGMVQVVLQDGAPIKTVEKTLLEYLEDDTKVSMNFGDLLARFTFVQEVDRASNTISNSLVLTAHHAVYDGWTLSVLLQILHEEYTESPSPRKAISFNRYVGWIKSQDLAPAKEFWSSQVSGAIPTNYPVPPKNGSYPMVNATLNHQIHLSSESLSRLQASSTTLATVIYAAWALLLSKYSNATDVVFGTVLAGREVSVPDIVDVVGPTISTVPMRIQIDPDMSVHQFLGSLQEKVFNISSYNYLGLSQIQKINDDAQAASKFQSLLVVQPKGSSASTASASSANPEIRIKVESESSSRLGSPRLPSYGPLADEIDIATALLSESGTISSSQTEYGTISTCASSVSLESISVLNESSKTSTEIESFNVTSKALKAEGFDSYAINLEFTPEENDVNLAILYDQTWIDTNQAQRIAHQLDALLQNLLNSPKDIPLNRLWAFSDADKTEILQWNTCATREIHSTVREEIEKQVQLLPDAEAVCSRTGSLTYKELDKSATGVALELTKLGVRAEVPVVLAMEKSIWALVAMLGILKAGGVIVPVDPSHPRSRMETICRAVGAIAIILSPGLEEKASGLSPNILTVTEDVRRWQVPDTTVLDTGAGPKTALYILFTSGTSGVPKGVVIENGTFCTTASAQNAMWPRGPGDRVFQVSSFSFDASMEDILFSLMRGACVCIPTEEERRTEFADTINALDANWMLCTPSLLSTITPDDIPGMKNLTLGGEPMTAKILTTWVNKISRMRNAYGPTECNIVSTMNANLTVESAPLNIGRAAGGTTWVVDPLDHNQLAPIGAVGELLISGPVLARGYLNDKAKTDAAFIYDPAWAEDLIGKSQRFYKTGDLVKYDSNGDILYVGRKDHQKKLRGQRFETGEVEVHLKRVLGDSADVIVDVVNIAGRELDQCLTAFINMNSKYDGLQKWEIAHLHDPAFGQMAKQATQVLKQDLPWYMVPQLYVPVNRWPLGLTGKVDRPKLRQAVAELSLSEIAKLRGSSTGSSAKMLNDNEVAALGISRKVASIVARDDMELYEYLSGQNFVITEVGLDSISMTSLSAYLKKTFGKRISFDILYKSSLTVRQLADLVTEKQVESAVEMTQNQIDFTEEISSLEKDVMKHDQGQETSVFSERMEVFFLTGATGSLGSEILRQLLAKESTKSVIVLVKASDTDAGVNRIIQAGQRGRWWRASYKAKVDVWVGDLDQPRLGLTDMQWQRLNGNPSPGDTLIDAIIHNGARVHWGHGYQALRNANVLSTVELLKAMMNTTPRPRFSYISGGIDHAELSLEKDKDIIEAANGYSQSKMVSDRLVCAVAARLSTPGEAMISVVRPGLIIGSLNEGVVNVDDFFWRLIAANLDLHEYNSEDGFVRVETVDRVAAQVLERACLESTNSTASFFQSPDEYGINTTPEPPYVTSISSGIMMEKIWGVFTQLGYKLQPVDGQTWLTHMEEKLEAGGEQHPLWPVSHLLKEEQGRLGGPILEHDVSRRLASSYMVRASVLKSVGELVRVGYLPMPNGQRATQLFHDQMFQRNGGQLKSSVAVQMQK